MNKLKYLLFLALFSLCTRLNAQQSIPFANELKQFAHADSVNFPQPSGLLFIGSSSIRLWGDLEKRFPGAPIIKRGVGGSEIWQWVRYYTPYVVLPYKPSKIFVYVGENDLAGGKTATFVAEQFMQLCAMIRQQLPAVTIYFMAIKQSPSRAKAYAEVLQTNKIVKEYIAKQTNMGYIDVATPILKPATALPDSALFKADMLHLNSKGYDKWQVVLQPYIK